MTCFRPWPILLLSIYLVIPLGDAYACFSMIVGKSASASQDILLARNSDSKDARRAKQLKLYFDEDGHVLYTGLPYADVASLPSHDMAQVSTNRYGVALSATQTIQHNQLALALDSYVNDGIAESNIPALIMPRSKTAKEGILLLGAAIQSRGVSDSKGFGVLLGDRQEAWYLETLSAHQWVAIRIPDDMYFVAANGPGQIQEYAPQKYEYLMSNYQGMDPITFATRNGIAQFGLNGFDFRATYGHINAVVDDNANTVRLSFAQSMLSPSTQVFPHGTSNALPMFLTPDHPISIEEVKAIQSSHYEAFPSFDPYLYDQAQPTYRPIASTRTSNAHITQISSSGSVPNVEYIALGMPSLSVYLPIYDGLSKIPIKLQNATNIADDDSLFWQFRKLQVLVFLSDAAKGIAYNFKQRKSYIQEQYRKLNHLIVQKQQAFIHQYQERPTEALVNEFTQKVVDAIDATNQELINHFMQELDIDSRYELTNDNARNEWFTRILRQQECRLRSASETQCTVLL